MKRSSPLTRKTALPARHSRITPKKRTKADTIRIYGTPEFRDWIHRQPCIIAGKRGHECWGEIQQAHIANGGTSRKADAELSVPMCMGAHLFGKNAHHKGQQTFQQVYDIDLKAEAARTRARWLAAGER